MSKIQDSILKVKLRHDDTTPKRPPVSRARLYYSDHPPDSDKQLALYRLRPGRSHIPNQELLEQNRVIHYGFSDFALTRYRMLRTSVIQQMRANGWTTLAVTSPQDGAGKTLTVINLAITLASQGGHDVYLIDLDLRNPSVADYLGLPDEEPGLAAYFAEDVELSDVLWDIGVENLTVLGNRNCMSDSSECLTSRRMREMFADLTYASNRAIVLIDLPPVLTADDAAAISPYVDSMLMVAAEGETTREDLNQAMDMLAATNIMGIVLNKSGKR